jgi:hypothetical protein
MNIKGEARTAENVGTGAKTSRRIRAQRDAALVDRDNLIAKNVRLQGALRQIEAAFEAATPLDYGRIARAALV